MAVSVEIKVDLSEGKSLETVALVNTGFETLKPELLLPVKAAEELDLWPNLPNGARVEIYDTAGGPMRAYIIPDVARVSISVEDRESESPSSDIVISHTEVEVLISDKLAGKLRVLIEDPGEGIWRFRDDPSGKMRASRPPRYWV